MLPTHQAGPQTSASHLALILHTHASNVPWISLGLVKILP